MSKIHTTWPFTESWPTPLKPFYGPLYTDGTTTDLPGLSNSERMAELYKTRIYLRNEKAFQQKQK